MSNKTRCYYPLVDGPCRNHAPVGRYCWRHSDRDPIKARVKVLKSLITLNGPKLDYNLKQMLTDLVSQLEGEEEMNETQNVFKVRYEETLKHSSSDEKDTIENVSNVLALDVEDAIKRIKESSLSTQHEYKDDDGKTIISEIIEVKILAANFICSIDL